MTIRGDGRKGEILITVDGALLDWRSSLAVRNHSPTGPSWAYGGSGPAQLALAILLAVTDEATAERFYQKFKWDVLAPNRGGRLGAGRRRRHPRLAGVGGGHGRGRASGGGGALSARRLLRAHLPAAYPERRETVAGACLGCQTQFAVDVRLPLPAVCPDCGADVLARSDIEGPETQRRPPFNELRIRRTKP